MRKLLCGLTLGVTLLAAAGCDEYDMLGWGSELLYSQGGSWTSPGYYVEEVTVETYEEEYWVEETYYDDYSFDDGWYW